MSGESPGGLDTELYEETNNKDSWVLRSLWPLGRVVASLDRKCLGPKMPGQSGRADGRDIFDEETRRKPLAFAADAGET